MGLGKTVMVLALLDARRQVNSRARRTRPSIVVVPRSLVFNWMRRGGAVRAGAEGARLHRQSQRDRGVDPRVDLVLTTYGTLRRDAALLTAIEFDYAILDEAQAIKNAATASAKAARLLRARHRLALSGTPIENHLGELWSLFEFLNPGTARNGEGLSARELGARRAARRSSSGSSRGAAAVHPAPHEGAGRAANCRERTEQTLHCELEARAAAALRRTARALPRRRCSRASRTRRRQSIEDADPRSAAAAAAGGVP